MTVQKCLMHYRWSTNILSLPHKCKYWPNKPAAHGAEDVYFAISSMRALSKMFGGDPKSLGKRARCAVFPKMEQSNSSI